MALVYVLMWILAGILIGYWANSRGRSFLLFAALGVVSPLLSVVILLIVGRPKAKRGEG